MKISAAKPVDNAPEFNAAAARKPSPSGSPKPLAVLPSSHPLAAAMKTAPSPVNAPSLGGPKPPQTPAAPQIAAAPQPAAPVAPVTPATSPALETGNTFEGSKHVGLNTTPPAARSFLPEVNSPQLAAMTMPAAPLPARGGTSVAQTGPTAEQLAQFRKSTGTKFNPNSAMDRHNLQLMQNGQSPMNVAQYRSFQRPTGQMVAKRARALDRLAAILLAKQAAAIPSGLAFAGQGLSNAANPKNQPLVNTMAKPPVAPGVPNHVNAMNPKVAAVRLEAVKCAYLLDTLAPEETKESAGIVRGIGQGLRGLSRLGAKAKLPSFGLQQLGNRALSFGARGAGKVAPQAGPGMFGAAKNWVTGFPKRHPILSGAASGLGTQSGLGALQEGSNKQEGAELAMAQMYQVYNAMPWYQRMAMGLNPESMLEQMPQQVIDNIRRQQNQQAY